MTKKLHIKTWGCQMNEYDSSKMADLLDATHGYQLTDVAEEADVLLLNTCSIREKAQEKVFHQLGRWKLLKEKNPDLIIGVGGCVASQEGEHIRQRAHYVDIIFGPQTLHRLPEMINSVRGDRSPVVDISFPEIEKFDRLPEPRAEGPTAFVSIMEGCNKYCTYCVVPYTRGEEVSRPSDDILFEIAQLAAQGVREVNLLGQNVNAWRGENYDGTTGSFADLLRLVAAIDGIDRIRFTTSQIIAESGIKQIHTTLHHEVIRHTPHLVTLEHRITGPRFAVAAGVHQNVNQGIDITITKIHPLPRQRMDGMRGIAHQRKPRLHILQRMATYQRKRASGKRYYIPKTRREMLHDFRL